MGLLIAPQLSAMGVGGIQGPVDEGAASLRLEVGGWVPGLLSHLEFFLEKSTGECPYWGLHHPIGSLQCSCGQ